MAQFTPGRLFRFGLFEADERTGELRRDGRRVRLQEQPFQVLLMLLERPAELVTREEIRQRLWPVDTFVDFDHGLNTAVNKLRDALGDSASNPRFIETLARRGYRFIAPVSTTEANANSDKHADIAATATAATGEAFRAAAGIPGKDKGEVRPPTPDRDGDAPPSSWALPDLLTQPHEVPPASRTVVRVLFLLIQVMYLCFYLISLAKLGRVHELIDEMVSHTTWAVVLLIITAAVGIPTRLYLISGVSFDYAGLGEKFRKLFAFIFPLDELWALAPFLLMHKIGFGLALGATAALLYLPFAQRALMFMGYPTRAR
ncbi:MAG: winged helix-turn-helix domain-containing protein [Acidobacteria bacterium]|nr:winged helix-turn-helix domain-containing protein [Acidobacteriota bacterium]